MRPYIQSEPNTRIRATSATNATNCRTCQLDKSYVLVHCPSTVLLALRQRFRVGGPIWIQGSKTGTRFLTLPYSYSVPCVPFPQSPCVTTRHTWNPQEPRRLWTIAGLMHPHSTRLTKLRTLSQLGKYPVHSKPIQTEPLMSHDSLLTHHDLLWLITGP